MALNLNPSSRQADLGFAVLLIAAAIGAFAKAGGYPGASGTYPKVLAVLLAIGAALVALRSLRQLARPDDRARLFLHPGRFVLGVAALVAYVIGIDLLGYLLPSLILGVSVPLLLGYRNLPLILGVTLGTIVFIVIVFFILLARPLPPDVLNPLLEVLR